MAMTASHFKDTEITYKKTLLYSRLPSYIFHNFKINTLRNGDGSINNTRYTELQDDTPEQDLYLKSEDWELLLGKETLQRQFEFSATQHDQLDPEGDSKMADDICDDTFKPFLDQEANYVTIMTYYNSFSIDNGPSISLPSLILSAGVLKATDLSQEDTLVLHLATSLILIRFLTSGNGTFEPYVVYSRKFQNDEKSTLLISSRNNSVALCFSTWGVMWYKISYDANGVPTIKHIGNNGYMNSIIGQCMVPVTASNDALITYSVRGGILYLKAIQGTHTHSTAHENMMKNNFPIPIHTIGLPETSGVLLLQENQYTIQSLGFCLTGDESGNFTFAYPELPGGNFKLNSFYVPQKKIMTSFSFDGFSEDLYKHDQVLVSTTNNNSVYVLDVYYDRKRHTFTSTMNRLFKYKQVVSLFIFEPVNDSTFRFTFGNELGLTESKTASIVTENDIPILKNVKEFWSEINPYPIFDYELIPSSGIRNSIENPSHDLWAIAGGDSNHSIMNFKFGLIADKIQSNQKWYGIDRLYSFQVEDIDDLFVWASGDSRSNLLQVKSSPEKGEEFISFNLEQFVSEPFLSLEYFDKNTQLIITPKKLFLFSMKNLKVILHLKLPSECLLASSYDNTVAMIYKEESTMKTDFVVFNLSQNYELELVEIENPTFTPNLVSMLQFIQISGTTYLFVGDFNGFCFLFKKERNIFFSFVRKFELKMDYYENHAKLEFLLPQYILVPYKIHQLNETNNFIVTSRGGDYMIINLLFSVGDCTLNTLQSVKLGDTGEVTIMPSNDPHIIYLSCSNLWKLDLRVSSYPLKIVVDGLKEHAVVAYTVLPSPKKSQCEQVLAIRGLSLTLLTIPSFPSVLIRSKRLDFQCMKMRYYSNLDLFILLPVPDPTDLKRPKLLFVESRNMKILETSTDFGDIFRKDEMPLCIHTWKVYESTGSYINLIVGCKTEVDKGIVKVVRLSKDNNKVSLKLVFSFKEDQPITHIDSSNQNRCLLYSSGKTVVRWLYSISDSKLVDRKVVLELPEKIKKFTLSKTESDNQTNKEFLILALTDNNKSSWAKYNMATSDPNLIEARSFNQFCSDGLISKDDTLITSNYNEESVLISSIHDELSSGARRIDFGYIPRLCFLNSYPPWVSIKDRCYNAKKQFITVGLNGQIDLVKIANGKDSVSSAIEKMCEINRKGLLSAYTDLSMDCSVNIRTSVNSLFEGNGDTYSAKNDAFVNNILI